jgi:hypothetical protein
MGERRSGDLGARFDARLRLEFHGAKVIAHSRRIVFQIAEVAVSKTLFEAILKRIVEISPAAA